MIMRHSPLDQYSRVWRVALFVLIVAAIVWLGATVTRALIGNDLLRTDTATLTLSINNALSPDAQREAFRLLSICSLTILGSYVVTLISSVVFLATSPFKLKHHGWLMMSAILFYLFVPVEVWTFYLDWKMIYLEFFTTEGLDRFQEVFLARVGALAGAPTVALLCYFTIIGLAVFQPMKKMS